MPHARMRTRILRYTLPISPCACLFPVSLCSSAATAASMTQKSRVLRYKSALIGCDEYHLLTLVLSCRMRGLYAMQLVATLGNCSGFARYFMFIPCSSSHMQEKGTSCVHRFVDLAVRFHAKPTDCNLYWLLNQFTSTSSSPSKAFKRRTVDPAESTTT